ncbi:unnamed protein product [Amoebophrya sp. A120]|nr:unnamed protein product [Amoebophrya sp. A120]|eukprot:GSA120T00025455001.1
MSSDENKKKTALAGSNRIAFAFKKENNKRVVSRPAPRRSRSNAAPSSELTAVVDGKTRRRKEPPSEEDSCSGGRRSSSAKNNPDTTHAGRLSCQSPKPAPSKSNGSNSCRRSDKDGAENQIDQQHPRGEVEPRSSSQLTSRRSSLSSSSSSSSAESSSSEEMNDEKPIIRGYKRTTDSKAKMIKASYLNNPNKFISRRTKRRVVSDVSSSEDDVDNCNSDSSEDCPYQEFDEESLLRLQDHLEATQDLDGREVDTSESENELTLEEFKDDLAKYCHRHGLAPGTEKMLLRLGAKQCQKLLNVPVGVELDQRDCTMKELPRDNKYHKGYYVRGLLGDHVPMEPHMELKRPAPFRRPPGGEFKGEHARAYQRKQAEKQSKRDLVVWREHSEQCRIHHRQKSMLDRFAPGMFDDSSSDDDPKAKGKKSKS